MLMIPGHAEEKPPAYSKITERVIIAGRFRTGERFKITRRSDGRFGFSVWHTPAEDMSRWLVVCGSEPTEAQARPAIEKVIEERSKQS